MSEIKKTLTLQDNLHLEKMEIRFSAKENFLKAVGSSFLKLLAFF